MNGKQFVQITKPLAWITDTVMPVSGAVVELSDGENTYLYKRHLNPASMKQFWILRAKLARCIP